MKILLLTDSLGFGGAQRQIANLAVELKALGHETVFVCYYKDDFYLPLLQEADIEPVILSGDGTLGRLFRIRRYIRSVKPDVVIAFDNTPSFCACFAAIGRHKWKTVISERVAQRSAFRKKNAILMKGMQAKYSDAIVCNSRCAQSIWEEFYPKTSKKLSTIYNIIDVPKTEAKKPEDGKCRLLIAARYEQVKNLNGLLAAEMLLRPEERAMHEIHWYGNENVIVGEESVLQKAKRFVYENGLADTVFLHPATDKIHEKMAASDYIALFSHIEGLPNSVIEGMTLRLPVVMSTVSDYAVLVDESNGFLCDPASPASIAEAIRRAIETSAEERHAMGERSAERIASVCAREAVVSRWQTLLVNLCENKKK